MTRHLALAAALLLIANPFFAQPGPGPNMTQEELTAGHLARPAVQILATDELVEIPSGPATRTVTPAVKSDEFIVMGYVQNETPSVQYPWHVLTHVACLFVDFDSNGNITNPSTWTNRGSAFQPGGTADKYGVKVLMTVRNGGFSQTTLDTVLQSASKRTTLINSIVSLIAAGGGNCAGVNLDFEPHPYTSGTRNGITPFLSALKAAIAPKELSMYVGPTYSSTGDDVAGWAPSLDFMNFSCYPWSGSWSSTAVAIAPENSYKAQVDNYLLNGCPPGKMVLTMPAYGYRMKTTTAAYGATKNSNIGSMGYTQGRFETGLGSFPRTRNYREPQESVWYAFSNGTDFDNYNYDDEFSLRVKMRAAQSWVGAQQTGRRLRGVAFWSLMWMCANYWGGFQSYDMEAGALASKYRTYPQIYQVCQELFAPVGVRQYVIDKWETLDPRWRNPDEGTDDVGNNGAGVSIVATPVGTGKLPGTGKPANSDSCVKVDFNFSATAGNRIFFRYEILGHETQTTVSDTLATKGYFDANTKVVVDVYTPAAYPGRTLRFMIMDSLGQLEMSAPRSLNSSGWGKVECDLASSPVSAYDTNFKQYKDGNGVLNTVGGGACDLAFVGVLIEGGGTAGAGSVYLDELRYTHSNPGGKDYVINEFRYGSAGSQFVEIHGPAGEFPAATELRLVDGSNGAAYSTISLGGRSVPDDGGGKGFFVVGVSGVPNADMTISSGAIQAGNPDALQLYNTATGNVYDAVVYEAFGGLAELDGNGDPAVTRNGYPWLGEVGAGTDSSGAAYTMGRYPDGANSWVNARDFSVMKATPGATNGNGLVIPASYDFSTAPPTAIQTYQTFGVTASGVGSSPGGGNVYRCMNTAGGGVQAFFGDASLGAGGAGYNVTGDIYIPSGSEPAQAIGVGICGSQGSVFFSDTPAANGYESGYWLIYENVSGVGLNDGRPDHPGVFEFVYASNDNMDGNPVTLLSSKTLAEAGVTAGTWNTFRLLSDRNGGRLMAMINGVEIYQGSIPFGGPVSGAFQVGFRENHAGVPAANEGTWIDNLAFDMDGTPVSMSRFDVE